MRFLLTMLSFVVLAACSEHTPTPVTLVVDKDKYSGAGKDLDSTSGSGKTEKAEDSIVGKKPDAANGIEQGEKPVLPTVPEPAKPTDPVPDPQKDKPAMGVLPNGQYTVKGFGSRKCLEPQGKSKSSVVVVQQTCTSSATQKWQFTNVADGYYSITNMSSMMALEIKDSVVVNEAPVYQGTYTNSPHQHFVLDKQADGNFRLKARNNPKLCVDVSFASADNNAAIQLWHECTNANEQWIVLPAI